MDRRHPKLFEKLALFFKKRLSCRMDSIQVPKIMDDGTTKWVTIIDRVKIEKLLIENNKKYVAQAEGTRPTIAPLDNIMGD